VKLCGLLTEAVRRKSLGTVSRLASDDEGMDDEMDEDEDDAQRDGERRDGDEPDEDLAFNDDHFTTDWEIEVDILKVSELHGNTVFILWDCRNAGCRSRPRCTRPALNKTASPRVCNVRLHLPFPVESRCASPRLPGVSDKRMKNDMVVRMSDQIFSHNTASFQILTNEMVSLLRREQASQDKPGCR
jgi:hypothetical protein